MLTKYVLPGEKIELQTVERSILGAASDKKAYTSKVYDVISDEQFEILMPMEKTKLILLPVDGEYDMCFYTRHGLYHCDVRIIDRYKSDNTFILLCEPLNELRKFQRREYYRFACILNANTRELTESELEAVERNEIYFEDTHPLDKSTIVDISGGGARFVSTSKYEPNSIIYMSYTLRINGMAKEYKIAGRVLASKKIENRQDEFEHRLQYVNIENSDREEIIRYIFEEERKNRQRRNGR